MQVLDQERRHDHADPVVHEAGLAELAHAGVDDRETGRAGFPGLEGRLRRRAGVDLDGVEPAVPVPPRAGGPWSAPRRRSRGRPTPRRYARGPVPHGRQVGDQGARVDGAELQMRRHPAGSLLVGTVAVVGVVGEAGIDEFGPPARAPRVPLASISIDAPGFGPRRPARGGTAGRGRSS